MRKDSERALEIILNKRKEYGKDHLILKEEDFSSIPNFIFNVYDIINELKENNCISSQSAVFISGEIDIFLTIDGIEYFSDEQKNINNKNSINYIINIGSCEGTIQFQQGNTNSNQICDNRKNIDYEKIEEVLKVISEYKNDLKEQLGNEKANDFEIKLNELESLVKEKKDSKIRSVGRELLNILEGTAGSIIASGIIYKLGSFLN